MIRNKYLKKLVESNPLYFPNELGLGEIKKQTITKEERLNKLLKHLEEQAKKEKGNDSRKNSLLLMNSRKESILLENKRKRTESVYEEIDNKKNKKEKKEKKEENEEEKNIQEENGEVSYYEEEENYPQQDDDDSQNYNYSYGEDNNED